MIVGRVTRKGFALVLSYRGFLFLDILFFV